MSDFYVAKCQTHPLSGKSSFDFFPYYMIMIVISFALVKFYAFAILYVFIVMQIKLVVVVVVDFALARLFVFLDYP